MSRNYNGIIGRGSNKSFLQDKDFIKKYLIMQIRSELLAQNINRNIWYFTGRLSGKTTYNKLVRFANDIVNKGVKSGIIAENNIENRFFMIDVLDDLLTDYDYKLEFINEVIEPSHDFIIYDECTEFTGNQASWVAERIAKENEHLNRKEIVMIVDGMSDCIDNGYIEELKKIRIENYRKEYFGDFSNEDKSKGKCKRRNKDWWNK